MSDSSGILTNASHSILAHSLRAGSTIASALSVGAPSFSLLILFGRRDGLFAHKFVSRPCLPADRALLCLLHTEIIARANIMEATTTITVTTALALLDVLAGSSQILQSHNEGKPLRNLPP